MHSDKINLTKKTEQVTSGNHTGWAKLLGKAAGKLSFILFSIACILTTIHIIILLLSKDGVHLTSLDHFFNLNNEQNIPTFFSSSILLFASTLLFIIYKLRTEDKGYWLLLSGIFLFLSLDEATEIHERIGNVTRILIPNDLSGYFFWAWIIPYTLVFILLVAIMARFIFRLPKNIRKNFLLAGTIFFTGAVIVESIEGRLVKMYEPGHVAFDITITTQEFLEMCGVIIFIYTLMKYVSLINKENLIAQERVAIPTMRDTGSYI